MKNNKHILYSNLSKDTNYNINTAIYRLKEDYQVSCIELNDNLKITNAIVLVFLDNLQEWQKLLNWDCILVNSSIIICYYLDDEEFNNGSLRQLITLTSNKEYIVIYANENIDKINYPTYEKITDTMYSVLYRIKYNSVQLDKNIESFISNSALKKAIDICLELGYYLKDNQLNNDVYAGFIAVKCEDYIMVTASKTNKYSIDSSRVCLIIDYQSNSHTITWVGNFPPTSESNSAWEILKNTSGNCVLLHFHHKPYTYSAKLKKYRTSKYVQYGTIEESEILLDKIHQGFNFVILNGHGEFVVGKDVDSVKSIILEINNLL